MIGGSLFYDFARVGATPARFQSFVLSAGVVTDYVYGAGMHWQGGCGGFPCDGSGSLDEWNVIGELRVSTDCGPRAGKRDFRGGEKCASTPPEPRISALRDPTVEQEARHSGPFSTTTRKFPQPTECVV